MNPESGPPPQESPDFADSEKQRIWDAWQEKARNIEAGIRDVVVVANALGLKTARSCEGHANRGSAPFVSFRAPGAPRFQFAEQEQQFADLARPIVAEQSISIDDVYNDDTYRVELLDRIDYTGEEHWHELDEWRRWSQQQERLRNRVEELIDAFYASAPSPSQLDEFLRIDRGRDVIVTNGPIRPPGQSKRSLPTMSSADLARYRAEFDRFAQFMKDRLVSALMESPEGAE